MKYEIAPKETEIQANWYDACLYCFSLNIDGKTGWRLPTKEESNEMYESENDFKKRSYWTFTWNSDLAWGKNFLSGYGGDFTKNGILYIRAVRDI